MEFRHHDLEEIYPGWRENFELLEPRGIAYNWVIVPIGLRQIAHQAL